jgi:hypothetical protein
MPFFGEEVRRPKAAPDGADSADVAILATKDPAREAARIAANQAMERYSRGEDPAFAELYDAIAPQLHHYLCRQTRDRTRADDLLQQTMLQIHRARGRFIAGAEVLPWAFAIARRLLIDSIRRRKNEAGHLSLDGAPPGRPRWMPPLPIAPPTSNWIPGAWRRSSTISWNGCRRATGWPSSSSRRKGFQSRRPPRCWVPPSPR